MNVFVCSYILGLNFFGAKYLRKWALKMLVKLTTDQYFYDLLLRFLYSKLCRVYRPLRARTCLRFFILCS
jgi:hypothetical protein